MNYITFSYPSTIPTFSYLSPRTSFQIVRTKLKMIAISYEKNYGSLDGMDSPQNVHISKVSHHSSKWSLTLIVNLLPIQPVYDLGPAVKLP
jgi:hypothetical protein